MRKARKLAASLVLALSLAGVAAPAANASGNRCDSYDFTSICDPTPPPPPETVG